MSGLWLSSVSRTVVRLGCHVCEFVDLLSNCVSINCEQEKVIRRIDLHHHFFPSSLDKLKKNAEMGWRTPVENLPWTPEISLKSMDAHQIDTAILSLPASSTGSIGLENRRSARQHNDYVSGVCKKYPNRFGFFASLPFLDDTEGEYCPIRTHSGLTNS